MRSSIISKRHLAQAAGLLGVALAAVLGFSIACDLAAPGGGGGQGPPAEGSLGDCRILNLVSTFQASTTSEMPLTVIYTTNANATNLHGYYVQVESLATASAYVGGIVLLPGELTPGTNQTFNLDLSLLTERYYRVGVRNDAGQGCESLGTLEMTDIALPEFTLPSNNVVAEVGQDVQIGFDAHDPAGALHWRLFYFTETDPLDVPPDELGTQIRIGQGNSDPILWNTSSLALGTYFLGLSTTDSELSVAETVAAGDTNAVRTISNPYSVTIVEPGTSTENSPLIEVTAPSATISVDVGEDREITIEFAGEILEPAAVNPSIDVFLDLDTQPASGNEILLESNLSPTATSVTMNTKTLAEDTYHVGATIDDGVNSPVTDYAGGRIVVGEPVEPEGDWLEVSDPELNLPVKPGTEVEVRWDTNVADDDAQADVFRRTVDADGVPFGPEIEIMASTSGVSETSFITEESGRFQVSVRLVFNDATKADLVSVAPAFVQVSSLPLVLWVGDLATTNGYEGQSRGALYEGHQFEDNAGSAMTGGEDFDGDGIADFIIAARYGKPEFVNPTGIGEGEAYLIRGTEERYRGTYNLNQASSPELPGLVFSGIPAVVDPPATTEGLASIFIATDADGDGAGELLFGFPFVSSFRGDDNSLEDHAIFHNGGVVIVSSMNSPVRGLGSYDTSGSLIRLENVGMHFQERNVVPEPDDEYLCSDDTLWMADNFSYYDGDCPDDEQIKCEGEEGNKTCEGTTMTCTTDEDCGFAIDVPLFSWSGCLHNSSTLVSPDGNYDTLIQPAHGFDAYMRTTIDFVNYYHGRHGYFPCSTIESGYPIPCPTCWDESRLGVPNPENPDPCSCEQWTPGGGWWWEVNIDETGNPPFCNRFTDDYDSADPLALWPEELSGLSCDEQHELIGLLLEIRRPIVDRENDGSGINPDPYISTGFYRDRIEESETDADVNWNDPREPWGARIIGRPIDDPAVTGITEAHEEYGAFGASIAQSGAELIISAPDRDAIAGASWFGYENRTVNINDVSSLVGSTVENEDAGVAYLFTNIDLWQTGLQDGCPLDADPPGEECPAGDPLNIPPKPHMYSAQGGGHTGWCLGGTPGGVPPTSTLCRRDIVLLRSVDSYEEQLHGGLVIAGRANQHIEHIIGIPDFNRDGRADYVLGAPQYNSDDGSAYIVFRRATSLEGDYILDKLALEPTDPVRLSGVYVIGNAGEQARLGFSLAGGDEGTESSFDFNADGTDDVAIGCPGTGTAPGSVLILFGTNQLTSPASGIDVDTLLDQRQAALITGVQARSEFGFNVANAGDFDGDGVDDLLISAPNATPMYDSSPDDSVDELDSPGLDRDLDGELDDVTGPMGIPDGVADTWDQLEGAGLAYVVFSSADTSKWSASLDDPMIISIDRLGTAGLPGFMVAGRRGVDLAPADPAHRHWGDRLGGGDAGDAEEGNPNKVAGRSRGLAAAGDVDGDGKADILIGAILADPRVDSQTGVGTINGGEAYLIYGFEQNDEQGDE